ncbi:MAG TPA: hypothetical protein VKV32_18105 [Stellaceae bacterium]|nr:hypothetical protein [Stellaceae bacterium]
MDSPGATYLYALATLTVTFAGFSALLLMIRQAAGAHLSPLDRFLTRTVIGHAMVLTAGALLPPLLQLYALPEAWVWKISALVFGLVYLAILATFSRRRVAVAGRPPPPLIRAFFIWLGVASLIAMIAYVLAGFAHGGAVYISVLSLNFFSLALAFIVALEVILSQPVDRK